LCLKLLNNDSYMETRVAQLDAETMAGDSHALTSSAAVGGASKKRAAPGE
jgi:hypothetical protein